MSKASAAKATSQITIHAASRWPSLQVSMTWVATTSNADTTAVKVGCDTLECCDGVFGAYNAGVFGGVVDVDKAGHLDFPFLTLVARLPGDGVILGLTLCLFKFIF